MMGKYGMSLYRCCAHTFRPLVESCVGGKLPTFANQCYDIMLGRWFRHYCDDIAIESEDGNMYHGRTVPVTVEEQDGFLIMKS